MFKVSNRNTKTRCEICSKLTIKIRKTPWYMITAPVIKELMFLSGLRIIVEVSGIFYKDYFTFYNRDWNLNSGTNFDMTCGKCLMKLFSDTELEIAILEI